MPPRAGREAESLDQLAARLRVAVRVRLGKDLKSAGLQGIASQDRRRLIVGAVCAGAAAAQIVIVHGRQIVVDERVGVQHLDAGRDPRGARGRDTEQRGDLQHEKSTQPLAAAQGRVAHGLHQPPLPSLWEGQERV